MAVFEKTNKLFLTVFFLLFSTQATTEQTRPCGVPVKQGEALCQNKTVAGYNLPAAFNVRECQRVSGFFDASFIYWYLREEGLGVATNGVLNTGTTYLTSPMSSYTLPFTYKPGFKISGGLVIDHEWELFAEYTWIRSRMAHSEAAPTSPTQTVGVSTTLVSSGTPVWSVTDWFLQSTSGGQALTGSEIGTVWRLNVDTVDLLAGRPFYQGPLLTVSSHAGLRAMWIRQVFKVELTESPDLFGTAKGLPGGSAPPQPIASTNRSQCWSIGPKFAGNCDFLLPWGFSIDGNLAASILYMQYTTTHKEDAASTLFSGPLYLSFKNFGYVRPVTEAGLGISHSQYWGSKRVYHTYFLASYDFTFLWSQNIMRTLLDDKLSGTSPSADNLFFHGLTLTGRFDF